MPRELKMLPMGTRDLALRVKILPMGTREKKRNPRQMMASCLSKLHSDPMFSILARIFTPKINPDRATFSQAQTSKKKARKS